MKKRIWGWYAFDWASQPFYTLLLTFVFGPYFAAVAAQFFLNTGLEGEAAALSDEVLQASYAAGEPGRQFGWQAGWTTFYWAWWIAFSPFVGLFLARISLGRAVHLFIRTLNLGRRAAVCAEDQRGKFFDT